MPVVILNSDFKNSKNVSSDQKFINTTASSNVWTLLQGALAFGRTCDKSDVSMFALKAVIWQTVGLLLAMSLTLITGLSHDVTARHGLNMLDAN